MKERTKDYKLMNIDTVTQMIRDEDLCFDRIFISKGFAINLDLAADKATQTLFDKVKVPYVVKDFRMLRLVSGWGKMELNFTEYKIKGGDILFIGENTYFEVIEVSPDAKGEVIVFYPQNPQLELAMLSKKGVKVTPSEEEWCWIGEITRLIYSTAVLKPYRGEVVEGLVMSLVKQIVFIHNSTNVTDAASGIDRLFKRFIEELILSGKIKRKVSYYSDRLCVTPQYLSKVVTQASGKSVSEWINKAVLLQGRILLGDTSRTISEISDTLGFPSDSHFCRFFKRETGLTPTEYRKGV